jgi:HD-like signal output (HDOD) protein
MPQIAADPCKKVEFQWDPECIPPFPSVALKAMNMMAGTDTSLLELCNLIRSDHAFSTAVLRIANSPLVAFSKNVTSVLQASMVLGFRRLRSLVITVGLKAYLADSFTPLTRSCWRHSVACAIIAEQSAQRNSFDKDFAYTAGILHDIGRVALVTLMPQSYAQVIESVAGQPFALLQLEREFCGIDHCQAGRSLVTAWNLPEAFLEVTSCHHDPTAPLTGAVSLIPPSCALADALGFAVVPSCRPLSYGDALANLPELVRGHFAADAEELASDIATQIRVLESV